MNKSLRSRALKSGQWVIIGHVLSQVFRLVSNLILTRLLVPEMFGVMAIVSIFMTGLAMFSDIGLGENIIQSKRGEEKKYLDTVWAVQIIRGVFLFLITLLVSYFFIFLNDSGVLPEGNVYASPELPFLLALMSIMPLISGFNSTNLLLLRRHLLMGRLAIIELISQVVSLVVMIIFAWYFREGWVLVLGGIVNAFTKMLLSHHPSLGEKNGLCWDSGALHEIIHFGKWIFISSILGFLLSQGDRLLLGGWVTPETLGVYSIAFFLAMALKEAIKKLVSHVFYPMLSEIFRTQPEKMKEVYYRIRLRVDFITMSVAGFMISLGGVIVTFLYDSRYSEAAWMFEMLSISIVFVGYSVAGMCLMAKGDSKSNMILTLIPTAFLYVSVPIGYHYYGLEGAVFMIAINYVSDIPITFYMMHKNQLLDIKKEIVMIPMFAVTYLLGTVLAKTVFS